MWSPHMMIVRCFVALLSLNPSFAAASAEWSHERGWLSVVVDGHQALRADPDAHAVEANVDDPALTQDSQLKMSSTAGPEGAMVVSKDGMRVLEGVVPHGGYSKQAVELEQWWTMKRDRTPLQVHGGCGMDYASPDSENVLGRQAAMLAEFGMQGVRIDVLDGHGCAPDWGSPLHPRPPRPVIIQRNWNDVEHMPLTPIGYHREFWMSMGREAPRRFLPVDARLRPLNVGISPCHRAR